MTEHDDVVLVAVNVAHMLAQQRFGLEPEACPPAPTNSPPA
jgi:hypothetical protein